MEYIKDVCYKRIESLKPTNSLKKDLLRKNYGLPYLADLKSKIKQWKLYANDYIRFMGLDQYFTLDDGLKYSIDRHGYIILHGYTDSILHCLNNDSYSHRNKLANIFTIADIIDEEAFKSTPYIKSIHAPFCYKVRKGAFALCKNLSKCDLNNVEVIEANAFRDCSLLSKINIDRCIKIDGSAFQINSQIPTTMGFLTVYL